MTKGDSLLNNELLKKVLKNSQLLYSCPRHEFTIDITPGQALNKRWKCTKCDGEVSSNGKLWYKIGLVHGGVGSASG